MSRKVRKWHLVAELKLKMFKIVVLTFLIPALAPGSAFKIWLNFFIYWPFVKKVPFKFLIAYPSTDLAPYMTSILKIISLATIVSILFVSNHRLLLCLWQVLFYPISYFLRLPLSVSVLSQLHCNTTHFCVHSYYSNTCSITRLGFNTLKNWVIFIVQAWRLQVCFFLKKIKDTLTFQTYHHADSTRIWLLHYGDISKLIYVLYLQSLCSFSEILKVKLLINTWRLNGLQYQSNN